MGNGAYRNVQQLDNPPRDARLIAATFRDLGFATVTLAPDLTRDNFFAALRVFGAEADLWKSIALTASVLTPLAAFAISRGTRPYGREVEHLEALEKTKME